MQFVKGKRPFTQMPVILVTGFAGYWGRKKGFVRKETICDWNYLNSKF